MDTNEHPLSAWLKQSHGRAAELARAIGVTPQSLGGWARTRSIPPSRCWQIEQLTGIRSELLNDSVTWHRPTKKGPPVFTPPSRPSRMKPPQVESKEPA